MENKALIIGLKQNLINNEMIEKILKLKEEAAKLGWDMDDYDAMDGNMYITFTTNKES